MTDTSTTRGGGRRRLQRGDLTRELIVRESLRLLDTDGIAGFSLPKLGRALGADATAVYRHFASKDDLVLAVADHLIEESAGDVRLGECWVDTLTNSARQIRRTYLAHPAAASLSSYRVTQGPAEMKAVDIIISCVLAAGFEGTEAAVVYRAIGDFGLYWSGAEASSLAMDEQLQKNDRNAWTTAYLTADQAQYPAIWQVREHLPAVDDDEIFEMSLSLMLAGLYARAPRPCTCPKHATTEQRSNPLSRTDRWFPPPSTRSPTPPTPTQPLTFDANHPPTLSATPATGTPTCRLRQRHQ